MLPAKVEKVAVHAWWRQRLLYGGGWAQVELAVQRCLISDQLPRLGWQRAQYQTNCHLIVVQHGQGVGPHIRISGGPSR